MITKKIQILICDDDSVFHQAIKYSLKDSFDFRSAYHGDEALAILKTHPIDILLLDIDMRTPNEGLQYLPKFKEIDPDLSIVMNSGKTDFNSVREAMRLGAIDYVSKDFNSQDLQCTLDRVLNLRGILQKKSQLNFETLNSQNRHILIGKSPAMQMIKKAVDRVRNSSANVIITGETGTGKEVVARQLRATLPDGTLAPFVAVDASTIQSSTAESILFGHEKGSFTGAEKTTRGIFEEANGGIVYFDEIANMSLEIQAKLLRVIQEKELTRLGSHKVIPLEFRVICATNKDLEAMSKSGHFKHDLLQRINVIPIHLTPLKERTEDIPDLIHHFMKRHAPPHGELRFTSEAISTFQKYPWPGNVRELGNLIAYLIAMTEGTEVDVADLPPKIRDTAFLEISRHASSTAVNEKNFYYRVSLFEKEILSQDYHYFKGNISKLALHLGMDRSHLYTKLREYGLHSSKSFES